MRFVDYSYALLNTAFARLSAGAPINVHHYNAIVTWLALVNDALVDPDGHLLRSSNEGSLGELMFPSVRAPSQIGQSLSAFVAGVNRPDDASPAWAVVVNNALSGAARDLFANMRITAQHVSDSIPSAPSGVGSYSIAALANDFELSAIDPTAVDATAVVHVNPATATSLSTIRSSLDQMLHALVNGQRAQIPAIVQSSQQLQWLAEERRITAQRTEIALVSILLALVVIVMLIGRSSARRATPSKEQSNAGKAGPIRLPGPNQPIGRAGMGPTKFA